MENYNDFLVQYFLFVGDIIGFFLFVAISEFVADLRRFDGFDADFIEFVVFLV